MPRKNHDKKKKQTKKRNSRAQKTPSPMLTILKITPKTVVEFVNALPKKRMSETDFRQGMESFKQGRFFSNYQQFARQLSLYYIRKDGMYVPRFTRDITEDEAQKYLSHWVRLYYLPNPTSTVKLNENFKKPIYLLKSIVDEIKSGTERDLYKITENILFQKITREDKSIYADALNDFSDIIQINNGSEISLRDGAELRIAELCKLLNEKDSPVDDEEHYFTHFNETFMNSKKQKILFGAPGTGKSHKIDTPKENGGLGLKNVDEDRKYRVTFHPDYDYAQFVGVYKPTMKYDSLSKKDILSKDELVVQFLDSSNNSKYSNKKSRFFYVVMKNLASIKYWNLNGSSLDKLLKSNGFSTCTYAGEVDNFLGMYDWFDEDSRDKKIAYEFVPQAFAKAYAASWKKFIEKKGKSIDCNQVYLVIEEINRGNCAQIFGDIFQLLDRDEYGWSCYKINADADFMTWLKTDKKYGLGNVWELYINDSHVSPDTISLPPNFNIVATMNTSDQSLFPMDSAFKRRFDWEYVPINYDGAGCDSDWPAKNFRVDLNLGDEKNPFWLDFLEKINDNICKADGNCEDKQMGEFFVKPKDKKNIDLEMFKSKVLFYLWDTIYKDCDNSSENVQKVFFFEHELYGKKETVTFQSFFRHDAEDCGKKIVAKIMDNLKVAPAYDKNGKLVKEGESYVDQVTNRSK